MDWQEEELLLERKVGRAISLNFSVRATMDAWLIREWRIKDGVWKFLICRADKSAWTCRYMTFTVVVG